MFSNILIRREHVLRCAIALILFMPIDNAYARGDVVLYAFQGGSDGAYPNGGIVGIAGGDLYGETLAGGKKENGTIFKLKPDGTQSVVYKFGGRRYEDGAGPNGGLISDASGNYYGVTDLGGIKCAADEGLGCGTIFKLTGGTSESVLYAFAQRSDGTLPVGSLVADEFGNLYGATRTGGLKGCSYGCGTVFKVSTNATESVLHDFTGGNDGAYPTGPLIFNAAGNLFGAATGGGAGQYGVVFMLAQDGTETVLYSFKGGIDGADPVGGLISDKSGNLYGTTFYGGQPECNGYGCGVVFKITPTGSETVLYAFKGGNDGWEPDGLIADGSGNLYGTTSAGGGTECGGVGCGVVFKIAPDGREVILHSFGGGNDGELPTGPLFLDNAGNLYGVTEEGGGAGCGGTGCGTVFEVKR